MQAVTPNHIVYKKGLDMEAIITTLLRLVILIIIAIGTKVIYPYIKSKVNEQTLKEIQSWAKTLVKAAELIYTEQGSGTYKLNYVTDLLNELLVKTGVSYTEDELRAIIESAVKDLKESE